MDRVILSGLGAKMDTTYDPALRAPDPGEALASWFDADRRGRFIIDRGLALRWCNSAGRAMLTGRGRLVLREGMVRTREPSEQHGFEAFVRSAGDRLSVHCLRDLAGDAHVVLAVRRLETSSLVGLTAYHSAEPLDYHWADLSQAFGLTPSEREIAQALSSGLTAELISDKLDISVKTVRTHIRHLYSKLDVSSREELFHKLAPYMLAD